MVYEAQSAWPKGAARTGTGIEEFAAPLRIVHRIGSLVLGEPSVIIVVRSAHRADGYAASRYAIDELKQRAPIWKEEHYAGGDSQYLEGVPLRKKEREES
jgi:molybdopterin synthase catalytic subunit